MEKEKKKMVKKILETLRIVCVKFLQFFVALMFVLCVMLIFMSLKDPSVLDFFSEDEQINKCVQEGNTYEYCEERLSW